MLPNSPLKHPIPPAPNIDPSIPYAVIPELTNLKSSDYSTALVHLFRGELGRQIQYRRRLDASTQYAVTVGATLTVLSFSSNNVPHYIHALIAFFIGIFLVLETRRYLYYSIVKYRVRQLELGFYAKYILGPKYLNNQSNSSSSSLSSISSSIANSHSEEHPLLPSSSSPNPHPAAPLFTIPLPSYGSSYITNSSNPNLWIPNLLDSIQNPHITITFFYACLIRLYRVYWGLFLGVYGGWVIKLAVLGLLNVVDLLVAVYVIGGIFLLFTIWLYCLFPYSREWPVMQSWYFAEKQYATIHEVDV